MKCTPISNNTYFNGKNSYSNELFKTMRQMREYNRIYNQAFRDGIMDIFGQSSRSAKEYSNSISKINNTDGYKSDANGIKQTWQAVGDVFRKIMGNIPSKH